MPDRSRIRIAIVGGGLAGAALANSLVQMDHLEVHVFESAPQFSERGAAVGLSVNSQNALSRVLNTDAKSMLLGKAGGVPMNSTRIMMVSRNPFESVGTTRETYTSICREQGRLLDPLCLICLARIRESWFIVPPFCVSCWLRCLNISCTRTRNLPLFDKTLIRST